MIVLLKNGDMKDINKYRPISLLSHMYKLFTRYYKNDWKKVLEETNQEMKPVSAKVTRQLIIFKQSIIW